MVEKMQFVLTPEDIGVILATHLSRKHSVDCTKIEYQLENVSGNIAFTKAIVDANAVNGRKVPRDYIASERKKA